MKMLRTVFLSFLLAAFALGASAQTPLIEGKHFTRVQMPQPTEVPAGKVEVIEFFWYGCPHCADLHPLLKNWVKKLPADVVFKRVPAIFRDSWVPGARIYYTLEALGWLDRLDDAVFAAMVRQKINLNDEKTLFDWIEKQGFERQKFVDMYRSFTIDGKVRKAFEMTQEYGFGGVPTIVVGGKYMPGPGLASYAEMLQVTDRLIEMNRREVRK